MTTIRKRWLDQLINWCKMGQEDHASCQAERLDRTALFTGIAKELEQAMKQFKDEQQKNGG